MTGEPSVERGVLTLEAPLLESLELPRLEARGAEEGPRVCLLAGVHGCEYASIEALTRFMRTLDPRRLRGSIVAVPVVSVTSYRARSPFVTPEDGKNINRCFPGDPEGTFSDVLAHEVFRRVIAPSTHLVDLHGGDLVEALEPFTLYDESAVQATAHEMAMAYGLPYVIRSERSDAIGGTTSAAAAAAGIPAILPEAGGCGQLDEASISAHVAGLENVLRLIGSLDGDPVAPAVEPRLLTSFVWLRSPVEGWWACEVAPGQTVAAGQRLGAVRTLTGDELHEVVAPVPGVVVFTTTSPAMAVDGILLALGGSDPT